MDKLLKLSTWSDKWGNVWIYSQPYIHFFHLLPRFCPADEHKSDSHSLLALVLVSTGLPGEISGSPAATCSMFPSLSLTVSINHNGRVAEQLNSDTKKPADNPSDDALQVHQCQWPNAHIVICELIDQSQFNINTHTRTQKLSSIAALQLGSPLPVVCAHLHPLMD